MKGLWIVGLISLAQPAVAGAPFSVGSVANWGPNGNGSLKHEDDLQWLSFHDVKVEANQAGGIYTARFGALLQKMEGQSITITGYMLPLASSLATTHFVLTRRSAGCPFCPPNEPTEAIEVFSQKFVKETPAPIMVRGRLHLIGNSERGLFFRIDSAQIS